MGIAPRHAQIPMAEQIGNVLKIGSAHSQSRGSGVPQIVQSEIVNLHFAASPHERERNAIGNDVLSEHAIRRGSRPLVIAPATE